MCADGETKRPVDSSVSAIQKSEADGHVDRHMCGRGHRLQIGCVKEVCTYVLARACCMARVCIAIHTHACTYPAG